VLVNNAGIVRDRMVFNLADSDWDEVLAVAGDSASTSCGTVQSGDGLLRSRTGWGCRAEPALLHGFGCPVL
jgi:hypothetical protein